MSASDDEQLSLSSLPDDLILKILSRLGPQERHRAVPRVSRRFRQLATTATQRAGTLSLELGGSGNAAARQASLCTWVLRYGAGHIHNLDLGAEYTDDDDAEAERPVVIAAMVAACSPQLRGLRLVAAACQPPLWGACLQRLSHLVLATDGELVWDLAPGVLPALGTLSLEAGPLVVRPSAHFPPSLSRLCMVGCDDDALPPQVASLTGLHSLSLKYQTFTADGYAALPPSLRRLAMEDCTSLPACLSRLTALEALVLDKMGEEEAGPIVAAALPLLQKLTLLVLDAMPDGDGPIAALTSCASLRSFFWLDTDAKCALPSGPWLASAQRLALPARAVANSPAALRAATCLEFLSIDCFESTSSEIAGALRAASAAPALRHMLVGGMAQLLGANLQLLIDAQRRCPHLHIESCVLDLCDSWQFICRSGYEFPTFQSLE